MHITWFVHVGMQYWHKTQWKLILPAMLADLLAWPSALQSRWLLKDVQELRMLSFGMCASNL